MYKRERDYGEEEGETEGIRQRGSNTRENVTTKEERKRARQKGEDSLEVVQERT